MRYTMKEDKFTPARGVTIDNALRYIEAIEEAVKRDFNKLPSDERSVSVGMIAGSLRQASDRLAAFRANQEACGAAAPMTETQKLQLRLIFRHAKEAEDLKKS